MTTPEQTPAPEQWMLEAAREHMTKTRSVFNEAGICWPDDTSEDNDLAAIIARHAHLAAQQSGDGRKE